MLKVCLYLLKVCLGVSLCIEKIATKPENDSYEMLVILFKNISKEVTEEELFKCIEKIKLDHEGYEKVKKDVEQTPNLERLV